MSKPKVRKLQDYPRGFPKISCFLDSDDAFMVYRRFGSVYSRLLLSKQDEMSRMEATLLAMDQTDHADGNESYLMSRPFDVEREEIPEVWKGQSRVKLLERMEKVALEYAELLLKAQKLKAMDRPSNRDYRSVLHFMENDGGQLFEEDMGFIYEKEDLITLRPGREYAWLDGLLERTLKVLRCRLIKFFFCPKETRDKTDDKDIHYYDRDRISTCVTMMITTIVLALLVVPIWLLYRFSIQGTIATSPDTIGVVLVFTLVFSAALTGFTKARRHEIVAASAGYCAVLVVFLGNVNNVGSVPR
ncbi:hypothetical protein HO133_008346 [Letharia lupina]|uniref:DUF6594 domain-containing protein n=1 Tax=Letharia lupina TaxID=560253 RepID=A0A8H6CNG3_9LECA|nr:uncharacterized protein HO133_008346 [Letharia lupina]KAF6226905.1 hypothetical protein HO133_008346 [Letharia lupina]